MSEQTVLKILSFLLNKKDIGISELMRETKISQPEISNAIIELERRGWVAIYNVPHGTGKGRPLKIVKLKYDLNYIINWYKIKYSSEYNEHIKIVNKILGE